MFGKQDQFIKNRHLRSILVLLIKMR